MKERETSREKVPSLGATERRMEGPQEEEVMGKSLTYQGMGKKRSAGLVL